MHLRDGTLEGRGSEGIVMRGRALGGSRAVNGRRLPLPVDDQGVSEVIFGTAAAVTEIHEVSTKRYFTLPSNCQLYRRSDSRQRSLLASRHVWHFTLIQSDCLPDR